MTQTRPYSLQSSSGSSDEYYQAVARFTDGWLEWCRARLARPLADFSAWRRARELLEWKNMPERGLDELSFELLVLGVLLREHGAQALDMEPIPAWVLARLVETQDNFPLPAVEQSIKTVRGWLQGLAQDSEDEDRDTPVDLHPFQGGAAHLATHLVDWLNSAGVSAQAERMAAWRDYFIQLDEQRAEAVLAAALLTAEEFAEQSEAALGGYTREVGDFILCQTEALRWRYDAPLITRTRVEYHLAMLGTEILTRSYRQRFLSMGRKIVIVPDCLCAHSRRVSAQDGVECKAELTSLGLKCKSCTPGCKVNALTRLGQTRGFEAYILPDDYRGMGLGACSKLVGVGVVGVSCLLTNWDAGWMVNDAGVPAQGVLLDYPGCKSHWNEHGETTDLNFKKLLEVVGA